MLVPNRHNSSDSYRYGFNGKELDNEVKGEGNSYDFGARMYDSRVGRWFAPDVFEKKYPSFSTYNFVENNPIIANDADGNELIVKIYNKEGNLTHKLIYKKGNFYHLDLQTGKILRRYNPGKEHVSKDLYKLLCVYRDFRNGKDKVLKNKLSTLENSPRKHNIFFTKETDKVKSNFVTPSDENGVKSGIAKELSKEGKPTHTATHFDFSKDNFSDFTKRFKIEDDEYTTVAHEMQHQYDNDIGNMRDLPKNEDDEGTNKDPVELRAVINENRIRELKGYKKREGYENDTKYNNETYKKAKKKDDIQNGG